MELFPISEEQQFAIYKKYKTNRKKIQEDVEILRDWYKKQPHLPQKVQYAHFLEKILSNCKFRVEKAKEKIESHFTLKNVNKNFFHLFESNSAILPSENMISIFPLPKLGPRLERIYILELKSPQAVNFHTDHFVQIALALFELAYRYDRCMSMRMIVDCKNFNFDYIKKLDIAKVHRMVTLQFEGYACKIESFDLINANPAVHILLSIIKAFLKDKIFRKFMTHPNLESLHRSIGTEYLPEQFGGALGLTKKIEDQLDDIILEHKKLFIDSANYITNENLRVGPCPYSHLFGLDGTFKQLSVD